MLFLFRSYKNIINTLLFILIHNGIYAADDHYKDRLKVYIDNSINDFRVFDDQKLTSDMELNKEFESHNGKRIRKWLQNARPIDHYNDKYLLQEGELLKLFPGMKILKYEEPQHDSEFVSSIILQKVKR